MCSNLKEMQLIIKNNFIGKPMKQIFSLLICFFLLLFNSAAQVNSSAYYLQNSFGLTSPGAMRYGLYGYDNPALLTTIERPEVFFTWSDHGREFSNLNHWGIFGAVPNFGFGIVTQKLSGFAVTDYKLTSAIGNEALSIGFGYGWSSGDNAFFNRSKIYTLGTLYRPNNYLSVGLIGNFPAQNKPETAFELAVRPFGNELISVFGDYVYQKESVSNQPKWSAGAAVEPVSGVRLVGRYFENKFFSAALQLSLGKIGFSFSSNFNETSKNISNVYGIRVGQYDRNILSTLFPKEKYVRLDLLGGIKYQRYKLFDNSNTLIDLLRSIKAAEDDKSISGIAINLSGMNANRTFIWEVRKALEEFRSTGKKIIMYFDIAGINEYHLASAADIIIIDPQGSLSLEGFILGRTFYKGTLEKLGVGFTELRYFKYKSAVETFSRSDMSEGDREQRQAIVDDLYDIVKQDVCSSRNISHAIFDTLVNNVPLFNAEEAIRNNLADKIGRWEKVEEIIEELEGEKKSFTSFSSLENMQLPKDNYWGKKPEIAVIYALGACAMDEGITARKLVKDVNEAVKDNNVKAIVLRVDSPGGSALASDIIAEAIKKAKGKKPVVVSQGFVAGSAGYWLSMYADTIVAAANTITGSIGVIGGFYYNKELKDKLGVTTDFVKKGKHADFGFGFTVPLLGITLPDRNLTDEELRKAEYTIKSSYNEFVKKVSIGRNKSFEEIDSIGQGRVWSGLDGKEIGLVDVIGNLSDAIDIAVKKASLTEKQYEITEKPEAGLLDFSFLIPKLIGVEIKKDEVLEHLRFRLENNGKILHIMPLDDLDIF